MTTMWPRKLTFSIKLGCTHVCQIWVITLTMTSVVCNQKFSAVDPFSACYIKDFVFDKLLIITSLWQIIASNEIKRRY